VTFGCEHDSVHRTKAGLIAKSQYLHLPFWLVPSSRFAIGKLRGTFDIPAQLSSVKALTRLQEQETLNPLKFVDDALPGLSCFFFGNESLVQEFLNPRQPLFRTCCGLRARLGFFRRNGPRLSAFELSTH